MMIYLFENLETKKAQWRIPVQHDLQGNIIRAHTLVHYRGQDTIRGRYNTETRTTETITVTPTKNFVFTARFQPKSCSTWRSMSISFKDIDSPDEYNTYDCNSRHIYEIFRGMEIGRVTINDNYSIEGLFTFAKPSGNLTITPYMGQLPEPPKKLTEAK